MTDQFNPCVLDLLLTFVMADSCASLRYRLMIVGLLSEQIDWQYLMSVWGNRTEAYDFANLREFIVHMWNVFHSETVKKLSNAVKQRTKKFNTADKTSDKKDKDVFVIKPMSVLKKILNLVEMPDVVSDDNIYELVMAHLKLWLDALPSTKPFRIDKNAGIALEQFLCKNMTDDIREKYMALCARNAKRVRSTIRTETSSVFMDDLIAILGTNPKFACGPNAQMYANIALYLYTRYKYDSSRGTIIDMVGEVAGEFKVFHETVRELMCLVQKYAYQHDVATDDDVPSEVLLSDVLLLDNKTLDGKYVPPPLPPGLLSRILAGIQWNVCGWVPQVVPDNTHVGDGKSADSKGTNVPKKPKKIKGPRETKEPEGPGETKEPEGPRESELDCIAGCGGLCVHKYKFNGCGSLRAWYQLMLASTDHLPADSNARLFAFSITRSAEETKTLKRFRVFLCGLIFPTSQTHNWFRIIIRAALDACVRAGVDAPGLHRAAGSMNDFMHTPDSLNLGVLTQEQELSIKTVLNTALFNGVPLAEWIRIAYVKKDP